MVTLLQLDQPNLGMQSTRNYQQGTEDPMVQNYTTLMVDVAVLMGANRSVAERDMKAALAFEVIVANLSTSDEHRRNPDRNYNPYTLAQLKQAFPLVNFEEYLRGILPEKTMPNENDTVIVREVRYLQLLQHVMGGVSRRTLANYLMWRVVQGFSLFLPPKLRQPFVTFRANQTGMPTGAVEKDRWEDCVTASTHMLQMPVGAMFVENFFDKEVAIKQMDELAGFLKESFISKLLVLDWMDDETRKLAIEKANTLEYKRGFPSWILDDAKMANEFGKGMHREDEPLLLTTIRIKLKQTKREMARYKAPVDKDFWYQSPAVVDAYYSPSLNQMIFPAGIMQFPFLSPGAPNYVVYGMAGAVVGHEVSHAFDDQGGRYDKYGNLHDWWKQQTKQKFKNKTECFVKQYGSILVPEVGMQLNGQMSLGENIADNAGVKSAYMAYKNWLISQGNITEPGLPGLQEYTNDQLFFLAYANNWCSISQPEFYKQLIYLDPHAPSKYRASVPLSNTADFHAAYRCPLGSPMNPFEKCEVW